MLISIEHAEEAKVLVVKCTGEGEGTTVSIIGWDGIGYKAFYPRRAQAGQVGTGDRAANRECDHGQPWCRHPEKRRSGRNNLIGR